jgi:TonB-dependent receptor
MTYRRLALAVPCLTALAAASALGQAGRGTLTGAVTDAQGRPLQGAKITVDPGDVTAITDANGNYTFTALASGNAEIEVNYQGFKEFKQSVAVVAGQSVRLDASLKIADNAEAVDVYAGRQGGEVEAINRAFTADNIISVLPADVITSLPNANVADAIGRLASVTLERDEGEGKYVQVRGTEPRLTNTTIDGVNIASAETVRQVKLDIIPANLVESVQINKTLQANMEGDGIGGSVDLRTKSAEDVPTIYLESTGGETPIIGGRPAYQFDGTLGKRFMGGKLGLLGGGSYDWNGRGINDVEPGPLYLGGYDERDYRYYRSRLGFAGTVDYRISDTSNVYLKGLYSLFHNYGDRWDYNFGTSFDANYQPVAGSGSLQYGAEIRRPVQDLGSLQLGGHHLANRVLLNWDVESSVGRTRDEGYDDATFTNNNAYSFAVDNSNYKVPKLTAAGVNVYDPTQYYLSLLRVNNYYNPEVDLGLGGSASTSYTVGGHASTIEVGGRFRNVHKFANQDTLYTKPIAALTNAQDATLQMTAFPNNFTDPNYYFGDYTFGQGVDYDSLKRVPATSNFTRTRRQIDQTGQNFDFIEKVSAGYAMDTINLGKFRVVGGLRFEETSDQDAGTTTPGQPNIAKNGSYLSVLPSASVRYAITPASGIRLVYGRGLSRPDFASLTSFATIAPGGVRTTSSIGNPNLKAEHADNLDLLYEASLRPVGLIQAGAYYKKLTNPIVSLNTTLFPGTAQQVIQTQPQNAGDAFVYGFEIAFQQHFTYLPGPLNGIGLSANYGYSSSRVNWPAQVTLPDGSVNIDRTDHPRLARQAPHTWNISPTYDKRRFSARLGLSYNAANLFAYQYTDSGAGGPFDPTSGSGGGYKGPNGDQYLYSHLQVDLQGTYRLPRGFEAVAYGLNLTNEVFGFYNGSEVNNVQREYYRQTFGGGLRWSPHREGR